MYAYVNATVNHTPDGYEVVINAMKTSWQQDGSYMPAKQDYFRELHVTQSKLLEN